MPSAFNPDLANPLSLPPQDTWPPTHHRFDEESVRAVQTALDIGRPLLLRGEPGIGKSQLARAVAVELKVPFLYHVVDERSERDDLLHHYDAVARLAEAQVSALNAQRDADWKSRLAERNFIRPGVLWWAFDWRGAQQQADQFTKHCRACKTPASPPGWLPGNAHPCGPVVLIDEIDKADPSVPNGLLECLGNNGFQTTQLGDGVRLPAGHKPPFVIITTNEERELPAAFLRRCLVLHLQFPKERDAAIAFLCRRGEQLRQELNLTEKLCRTVAECICKDREEARSRLALPGASEFLELLRALAEHCPGDEAAQQKRLEQISHFVLRKHDAITP